MHPDRQEFTNGLRPKQGTPTQTHHFIEHAYIPHSRVKILSTPIFLFLGVDASHINKTIIRDLCKTPFHLLA